MAVVLISRRRVQGVNTEKFVPNPRHTTPLTLKMYEFVGKLIGIALRTRNYIAFELAPIVWKLLIGAKPTLDDIKGIDEYQHTYLQNVRSCTSFRTTTSARMQGQPFLFSVLCVCSLCGLWLHWWKALEHN